MKNNRPKYNNETTPAMEECRHEYLHELRYDFQEVTETDEEGNNRTSFNYNSTKSSDYSVIEAKKNELGLSSNYTTLPVEGEWVSKNKLYEHNGKVVRARQNHYRTSYTPEETPALFVFVSGDEDVREWIPQIEVKAGDILIYNKQRYQVIQGHTTQNGWKPDSTPALFEKYTESSDNNEGVSDWQAGVQYSVGDHVMYNGTEYSCLQAHTSQTGWEPSNVPALWEAIL